MGREDIRILELDVRIKHVGLAIPNPAGPAPALPATGPAMEECRQFDGAVDRIPTRFLDQAAVHHIDDAIYGQRGLGHIGRDDYPAVRDDRMAGEPGNRFRLLMGGKDNLPGQGVNIHDLRRDQQGGPPVDAPLGNSLIDQVFRLAG